MKVSVIIPVFNVSTYIERCVSSVLDQRFTHFECLLVDDGSVDDSMDRVGNLLGTYQGPISFCLLTHDRNMGLPAARNTGIRAAKGEFLYFLDGDDTMMPDCLDRLIRLANAHPKADLIQGASCMVGPHNGFDRYRISDKLPDYSDDQSWIGRTLLERRQIPVTSWNKLIKRDWLFEHGLFFKEGIVHEDEHWTYFAASCVGSMAFCKEITYCHFIHEGSIMHSQADRSIRSWFAIIGDFVSHQHDSLRRIRRKVILEVAFCNLVRIVKKGSKHERVEMIAQLRDVLDPFKRQSIQERNRLEKGLLNWFVLPLPLMKVACAKHIKGLYFHLLDLLPS